MIDELFTEQTLASVRDRIDNPSRLVPARKESVWGAITAVPRAVTEAVAQRSAGIVEAVAGFGSVLGAYPEMLGPVTLTDEQRRQADVQRERLLAQGPDVETEIGRSLRNAGAIYRPDPATASTAEQLLYGFARGATKIVTAAPAGLPGFVMAGAEEAASASDDLAAQGVPQGARMAAGAVQGAGLALAALPLVGTTLPQTAALYVAGGPGGFMAQQALTREILRNAGQDKVAEQFDPFDPVGLSISALLPAGFTAYGLRAQRMQRAAASLPPTLAEARGEVAPVPAEPAAPPEPIPSARTAVADAVQRYGDTQQFPPEVVDAAMAMNIAERGRAAEVMLDSAAWRESAASVQANVMEQLRATGRFDEEINARYSEVTRAFYETMAARTGRTPDEMFSLYPLRIRGETTEADALAQAKAQTGTPQFRAWFGDSKVVDAKGEPLVVYRGGPTENWRDGSQITEFRSPNGPWAGFFTNSKDVANRFAQAQLPMTMHGGSPAGVFPVFISMDKPLVVDAGGRPARDFQIDASVVGKADSPIRAQLLSGRYDGLILRGTSDEGDVYVPLRSEQIKSAIGNRGTFDPNDPSILNQGDAQPRGTYTPGERAITLLENADLSTFLHESGHFYLDVMADIAARPDAPMGIADDMGKVLDWFGITGLEEVRPGGDGAPLEQPAYHGTPHAVDRFSLHKIGSGEGAQAFGWGLYFAGKRDIAEHYRKTLSDSTSTVGAVIVRGQKVDAMSPEGHAARLLFYNDMREMRSLAKQMLKEAMSGEPYTVETAAKHGLSASDYYGRLNSFIATHTRRDINVVKGNLYEVELPEDTHLLDYDKGIGSQPAYVQERLKASGILKDWKESRSDYSLPQDVRPNRGGALYALISHKMGGDQAASQWLHSIGIVGMRYKAGSIAGTRGGGHNYVIWDEGAISDPRSLYQGGPDATPGAPIQPQRTPLETWQAMSLDQQRPYHEQFARGFERYLAEGRAPTPGLRGVFERFKSFLLKTYRSLTDLNVNLSDEVRGVFDRLLAAEPQPRSPAQEWADDLRLSFEEMAAGSRAPPEPASIAADLRSLAAGAGWAETGGRMIRDPGTAIDPTAPDAMFSGDVVGRTQWIPHEEWFGRMRSDLGRGGLSDPSEIRSAVEKAIAGEKMLARERRTVEWMQTEVQALRDRMFALDDADDVARDAFGAGLSSRDAADIELTAHAAEIDVDAVERASIRYENDDAGFRAEMQRIVRGDQTEAPAAATAADQQSAGPGARGADPGTSPQAGADAALTFSAQLDAALAERGIKVVAGNRSQTSGEAGAREIVLADMTEGEFMAAHGNTVADVKAHEFAHTFWDGATATPNFRDPRNKALLQELRTVSREFRPYVWNKHPQYANKPSELLADGLAFWMKNPGRRREFVALDKLIRDYDAGALQRQFPDDPASPGVAEARPNGMSEAQATIGDPAQPGPRLREMTDAERAAAQGVVVDLRKRVALLARLRECMA